MKREFCQAENRKEAKEKMPWATKIVQVDGGYMGFETLDDYRVWKNQK